MSEPFISTLEAEHLGARVTVLEIYVDDLRDSVHKMLHGLALIGGAHGECSACGADLTERPGKIK